MISFNLNSENINWSGDTDRSLLDYLRNEKNLTAVKDGCSGQAACGACTVEINGKAKLSCVIKMKSLQDAVIYTPEGFPEYVLDTIAKAFVNKGAVQCGFCTPGFISRTKVLLQENPNPTIEEIRKAIKPHLCRCTGYKKIVDSIILAARIIRGEEYVEANFQSGKIGTCLHKYNIIKTT